MTTALTARQVQAILRRMPFNHHLGIHCRRVHRDGITIECPLRPELMNGAGVLHGGVTATMADVAVGLALQRHFGRLTPITTVELKVNYIRPVPSGKIVARSHLMRVGSRVMVGRVDLFDGHQNLVGAAIATYIRVEKATRTRTSPRPRP